MTFAGAALIASSTGYSGCLLGTRIVDDDADLRPLQPPVITASSPVPPGTMWIIDDPSPTDVRRVLDVTIMTDSRSRLFAQWWIDRRRPCDSVSNCGQRIPAEIPEPAANDTSNTRHISQEIDIAPHHCSVVDLYVSSAFKFALAEQHEPERAGDIAFARWFIVRVDPARQMTDPISFADCVREQY